MDEQAKRELLDLAGLCAVVEATLHWFPWNKATDEELFPPVTYVVGLIPILGTFVSWTMRRRKLTGQDAAVGLGVITSLAGATVTACYLLDRCLGARMRRIARGNLRRARGNYGRERAAGVGTSQGSIRD